MRYVILVLLVLSVILILGCAPAEAPVSIPAEIEEPVAQDGPAELITEDELAAHNSEDDCWIVYEGKVYDFSDTDMHPNMAKTFYQHCGKTSGFEEGARARHSSSSEDRVANYGTYIGELE